jgi:hypothetical protein
MRLTRVRRRCVEARAFSAWVSRVFEWRLHSAHLAAAAAHAHARSLTRGLGALRINAAAALRRREHAAAAERFR